MVHADVKAVRQVCQDLAKTDIMAELQHKNATYRVREQSAKDEFRKVAWACKVGAIQAKAQLELRGWKDIKGNKKNFYKCISNKRMNKENVGPFLKGLGDLVATDTGGSELP